MNTYQISERAAIWICLKMGVRPTLEAREALGLEIVKGKKTRYKTRRKIINTLEKAIYET